MPELPEVECLTRAVRATALGKTLLDATFYRSDLRSEIPIDQFKELLVGKPILSVDRRSKYMLLRGPDGCGIFHLGMSGNMLRFDTPKPQLNHTHAVFTVGGAAGDPPTFLHFIDPRRFGWITCCALDGVATHKFFAKLGPEPLGNEGLGEHLYQRSRGRAVAIKSFLMDAHNVVGVGNIYASEALFRAGIHPLKAAKQVTRRRYGELATKIQETLEDSIRAGGTTFRDFRNPDGNPGYFEVSLNVYGRKDEPCHQCGKPVHHVRLANRATYFCSICQK